MIPHPWIPKGCADKDLQISTGGWPKLELVCEIKRKQIIKCLIMLAQAAEPLI
jgi:hypothetical protein